jgi:hypothetical protein
MPFNASKIASQDFGQTIGIRRVRGGIVIPRNNFHPFLIFHIMPQNALTHFGYRIFGRLPRPPPS